MKLNTLLINKFGKLAGWNSITTTMLGRDLVGATELAYDDTLEKENVYGSGGMPVGRGEGNYAAKLSITFLKEELDALQVSLGPGGRLTDIAPFDVTVQYEYLGKLYKDRIHNVEFTGRSVEVKQNDKSIATKCDMIVSHVSWNII